MYSGMNGFFSRTTTLILMIAAAITLGTSCTSQPTEKPQAKDFVKVENGQFIRNGKPYYFVGTNFWYGAILGSQGEAGDRERLVKELDMLKSMGVDNLRVLVGGDGDNGVPLRIEPTLQTAPGVYNEELLDGLDYLLMEMGKRDMTAVLYLNNSWEWSGGYTQYVAWANGTDVPVPTPGTEGWDGEGWARYMASARTFVRDERAKELFYDHVRFIVSRTNSYTDVRYIDDPTIFSWQIGNEPRAFDPENKELFAEWILQSAKLIRELDPNHLISTGSEGYHGCEQDIELCQKIHAYDEIGYINCHVWPYNWKWIDEENMGEQLPTACENTKQYIAMHIDVAEAINKPLVVEEFGFPRNEMNYAKQSNTSYRDTYYGYVFDMVKQSAEENGKFAGCNFWGWGGHAEKIADDYKWAHGYDYTGDPAQEPQGCNSVFADDSTTIELIKQTNETLANR